MLCTGHLGAYNLLGLSNLLKARANKNKTRQLQLNRIGILKEESEKCCKRRKQNMIKFAWGVPTVFTKSMTFNVAYKDAHRKNKKERTFQREEIVCSKACL